MHSIYKGYDLKRYMPPLSEFTAILKEKRFLTDEVMYLSFEVADSFSFQAGQYGLFKIMKDADFRWKSYSILNPPSEKGKINLCVSIIPGGFASEVFKAMKVGDALSLRGPVGHFAFDAESNNQEHWFICVGTGITPLHSMIKEHLPLHLGKKFILLFGDKATTDLLFYDEFTMLEKQYSRFEYVPVLSREKWKGKTGRVQHYLPREIQGKTFYISGLKEMVLETKGLLEKKGVKKEDIKVERYT